MTRTRPTPRQNTASAADADGSRKTAARQRGIYALEWAIVFPVFFALLYAIISYGLTFLVRESMQFAVEEGARAALRYPAGVAAPTWEHRRHAALAAVTEALGWLPANLKPAEADIRFAVCPVSDAACGLQTALDASLACQTASPCLVLVSYTIEGYAGKAIAPAIPGFGLLLPDTLQAHASILANGGVL